jgi:hypothetical protein
LGFSQGQRHRGERERETFPAMQGVEWLI